MLVCKVQSVPNTHLKQNLRTLKLEGFFSKFAYHYQVTALKCEFVTFLVLLSSKLVEYTLI